MSAVRTVRADAIGVLHAFSAGWRGAAVRKLTSLSGCVGFASNETATVLLVIRGGAQEDSIRTGVLDYTARPGVRA
jgi:hypothetical protein